MIIKDNNGGIHSVNLFSPFICRPDICANCSCSTLRICLAIQTLYMKSINNSSPDCTCMFTLPLSVSVFLHLMNVYYTIICINNSLPDCTCMFTLPLSVSVILHLMNIYYTIICINNSLPDCTCMSAAATSEVLTLCL